MDTPVTSPEGSDKGGKLPRQLQLSPASARHFHVVLGGTEDYLLAAELYEVTLKRWPTARIQMRQGARIVYDSMRVRPSSSPPPPTAAPGEGLHCAEHSKMRVYFSWSAPRPEGLVSVTRNSH